MLGNNNITCSTEDGGGPSEVAVQAETSNHLKLLWAKDMVVSVKEKASQTRQVRVMELNESKEPLMYREWERFYQNQNEAEALG